MYITWGVLYDDFGEGPFQKNNLKGPHFFPKGPHFFPKGPNFFPKGPGIFPKGPWFL
jgi:hypothetical protein